MHIARLTDPAKDRSGRTRLTLNNLSELVDHAETKAEVDQLLNSVKGKTDFCRDWRNRVIAHRDRDIALGAAAVPLKKASKKQVTDALDEMERVLNAVELHYSHAATSYGGFEKRPHTAIDLLYVLDDGIRRRKERRECRRQGKWDDDDPALDI